MIFPKVIAHRGLSSKAPENTLAAIALAAEKGMQWVEVDVKLTADGVFILCHDATVDRTTNGNGKIAELTSENIFTLDAGSWFDGLYHNEKIPSLEKTLWFCKKHKLGINLELKPDAVNIKDFASKLVPIIIDYQQQGVEILVSCFNKQIMLDVYQLATQLNSKIPLGFLIDKADTENLIINFSKKINCVSIHLNDKHCTKKSINQLKNLQKNILVYTVNDISRAKDLFSFGVDTVFSDYHLTFKD